MVVQNAIDNLKDRPHDEKKVVASGIAVGIVVVLLIGWGFLFLRKIQRGTMPTLEGSAVPQDQIDAQFIQDTQQQINDYYQSRTNQYDEIRDAAAENEVRDSYNAESVDVESENQFGAQQSDF